MNIYSDPASRRIAWKKRALEMNEAQVLFASFFCGMALYMFKALLVAAFLGELFRGRIASFIPAPGFIDSIFLVDGAGERPSYSALFNIKYSVDGKEYLTDYFIPGSSFPDTMASIELAWKSVNALAPNQPIYMNRNRATKHGCEFLISKNLRSEINTPVVVRYDPEYREWTDWKIRGDNYAFLFFFALIFGLVFAGMVVGVYFITKQRSMTSRVLNWSVVLIIGLVTGPIYLEWKKIYAGLFPNHPLEPAQIIPFDERLDPKVCDALK